MSSKATRALVVLVTVVGMSACLSVGGQGAKNADRAGEATSEAVIWQEQAELEDPATTSFEETFLSEATANHSVRHLFELETEGEDDSVELFKATLENVEDVKMPAEDPAFLAEIKNEWASTPVDELRTYGIPVVMNPEVERLIYYFSTDMKDLIEAALGRSSKYEAFMRGILREEGLPEDIVWICLVESAFKDKAYSSAGASGLWQFIESTGQLYGLVQNYSIDERRDPELATRAAARFLRHLYGKLHSWPLAFAAYNAGLGRVDRAIQRGGTENFWELSAKKLLPEQTRTYVPAIMAGMIIAKNPARFGFSPAYEPARNVDRVEFSESIDLAVLADATNIPAADLARLNPHFRRPATPSGSRKYNLYLPRGSSASFLTAAARIPNDKKHRWTAHSVRRGETLGAIAQRYGISIDAIMGSNAIRNPKRLRVGQELRIPPRAGAHPVTVAAKSNVDERRSTARRATPAQPPRTKASSQVHKVRPGDTLYRIAQRYGVSLPELRRWNKLGPRSLIHPGDLLTLFVKN
ncbi:MAG: LysM peptidoglycan-binding domain-containing protein [Candidatus Schekmanbacteria bacterium]|nr:LysM peptidoglycan-binding domain-containing protein [Candidatus Schekmanbacteria bacterium]